MHTEDLGRCLANSNIQQMLAPRSDFVPIIMLDTGVTDVKEKYRADKPVSEIVLEIDKHNIVVMYKMLSLK